MYSFEPPAKRARLDRSSQPEEEGEAQREGESPHSTQNITIDPFQSASASGGWYYDGFSQDPGFLASQEELRAILFELANSAAPTRTSSPDSWRNYGHSVPKSYHERRREPNPLSSRRRIEYLKNYVAEIAPWVSASAEKDSC